jgi:predicted metalloendopeptidase
LIDWSSLLNNLSGTQYSQPHTPISAYIEFFERLQVVLSPVTIQAMQDFLIVDFALNQNAYFQQTSVSLHSPQRWTRRAPNPTITDRSEICASDISTSFPDALGRYYTLVTFGASKEVQRLEGFVKQMQVSWLNHIPGTPWLDQATAVQAYEKVLCTGSLNENEQWLIYIVYRLTFWKLRLASRLLILIGESLTASGLTMMALK